MAKYHVSEDGNARVCDAEEGNCPFGSDTPHFKTKKEAQSYYESTQDSFLPVLKTKVYRAGSLVPPESHFEDLEKLIEVMDAYKPDGVQGRKGGIFASIDMNAHSRWLPAMRDNNHEDAMNSHEITVDANRVYVYSVESYEYASSIQYMYANDEEKIREAVESFWNSGVTLAEWKEKAPKEGWNSRDWEILMPATAIMKARKMSNKEVIEKSPDDRASEINWLLEPRRASKGLIWRKKEKPAPESEVSENS